VRSEVESTIAERPDEVQLVGTTIANPWFIHALRIDSHNYHHPSDAQQCMTEIYSSLLIELTDRRAALPRLMVPMILTVALALAVLLPKRGLSSPAAGRSQPGRERDSHSQRATLLSICGRCASSLPPEGIARLFGGAGAPNIAPNWNMAPTQSAMVIRRRPRPANVALTRSAGGWCLTSPRI
jgi:hypothetical protein